MNHQYSLILHKKRKKNLFLNEIKLTTKEMSAKGITGATYANAYFNKDGICNNLDSFFAIRALQASPPKDASLSKADQKKLFIGVADYGIEKPCNLEHCGVTEIVTEMSTETQKAMGEDLMHYYMKLLADEQYRYLRESPDYSLQRSYSHKSINTLLPETQSASSDSEQPEPVITQQQPASHVEAAVNQNTSGWGCAII